MCAESAESRSRSSKKAKENNQPGEASYRLNWEIGSWERTPAHLLHGHRLPDNKRHRDDSPTLLQSRMDTRRLLPIPKTEIRLQSTPP